MIFEAIVKSVASTLILDATFECFFRNASTKAFRPKQRNSSKPGYELRRAEFSLAKLAPDPGRGADCRVTAACLPRMPRRHEATSIPGPRSCAIRGLDQSHP